MGECHSLTFIFPTGEPCSHFVVEAADPKSPLRAARTYFFSAGSLPTDCLAGTMQSQPP
jgi:hypothetical protein